jgi:hypothetical protein
VSYIRQSVPEARWSDNQHSHSDHQRHDEQKNRLYLRRYLKRVVGEKSVCDSYPARAECGFSLAIGSEKKRPGKNSQPFNRRNRSYFSPALPPLKSED